LLDLPRSSLYYASQEDSAEAAYSNHLMRLLDKLYMNYPFYGVVHMTVALRQAGELVNEKRVRRLLRLMGLEAIYPKPRTSVPDGSSVYPYLLRDLEITVPNQVWCTDITYIPLHSGWAYLVAVMDWHSRYVLAWELSATLDVEFCLEALRRALDVGVPGIFNSDQGSQFTSSAFTGALKGVGVRISMDGRGRAFDNIFIERLWRSVKYEEVYLRDYQTPVEAREYLARYLAFYNHARPHQSLDWRTPASVYGASAQAAERRWLGEYVH